VDPNQLYFDHQAVIMRLACAISSRTRHECEVSASPVAGRIGCVQRAPGAPAIPIWEALAAANGGSLVSPLRLQQGYAW
jgi:hypothetical protein